MVQVVFTIKTLDDYTVLITFLILFLIISIILLNVVFKITDISAKIQKVSKSS